MKREIGAIALQDSPQGAQSGVDLIPDSQNFDTLHLRQRFAPTYSPQP
jgi:hypothetical protein